MVHRGPEPLTELGPGAPSPGYALAVHVADLAAQRRRAGSRPLAVPQRVDTHVLTLITRGRGRHVLDFEPYPCAAGTLLWVRPGQVQQFQAPSRLGGVQVRFTATVPASGAAESLSRLVNAATGVQVRRLAATDQAQIGGSAESLAAEYAQADDTAHHRLLLSHLLLALLLRVDRIDQADRAEHADSRPRTATDDLYTRFADQLELDFTRTRRVPDYASLLGCPARTLTLACQEATGRSAKDLIDGRLVLEAKRLLATTDDPLIDIAHRLGFNEATTLARYFARHSPGAQSPTAFRKQFG